MCKMIIHYRTYLQNGIANAFVMPNNFYNTSNQIQTPFNYYFDTHSDNCMMYYSMVFKSNDTVPDVQDDHPLQTPKPQNPKTPKPLIVERKEINLFAFKNEGDSGIL